MKFGHFKKELKVLTNALVSYHRGKNYAFFRIFQFIIGYRGLLKTCILSPQFSYINNMSYRPPPPLNLQLTSADKGCHMLWILSSIPHSFSLGCWQESCNWWVCIWQERRDNSSLGASCQQMLSRCVIFPVRLKLKVSLYKLQSVKCSISFFTSLCLIFVISLSSAACPHTYIST